MFETLPSPSFATLLIVLRGVLLIGAFWVFAIAFTRWRRADERDAARLTMQLERAFAEMRSLHETVTVMNSRIEALVERMESEAHLTTAGATGASRGYDLAMRLAKNGAPIDELVATCGLTRHEAELLARLHTAKREAAGQRRSRVEAKSVQTWPPESAPAVAAAAAPPPPAGGRKRGSLLSVVG